MEQAANTAVVYFSLTGHSERAAKLLAKDLNAKLIALNARTYRSGFAGYLHAGFDSLRRRCKLDPQTFVALDGFDLLVVCGPVWTSYPAVPLRALLQSNISLPAAVGLFLTNGGHSPAKKAYLVAEQDLGHPLVAKASLSNVVEGTADEDKIF